MAKRDLAFLFGVLSLAFSSILYGAAPEWLPFAYTAQSAFYLPTRIWTYKRKAWHYFLFEWVFGSRFRVLSILTVQSVLLCQRARPALDLGLPLIDQTVHLLLPSHNGQV
jgi:hypothetical protein